ncbi:MAG: spore cortex biosynthesis protein YabQ [Eubacteriaceae bacterium]
MYENIYLQIYVFLYTLYGGIIIGIVYDLIDVIINGNYIKKRSISDLLFWGIAFSIMVVILFNVNNITFRSYTLIGFTLGWFIYFLSLSKFLRIIFIKTKIIIDFITKKIIIALRFIYSPLNKIVKKQKTKMNSLNKIKNKVLEDFNKYKRYLFKH